jgi:hypothetical protein
VAEADVTCWSSTIRVEHVYGVFVHIFQRFRRTLQLDEETKA